MKRSGMSLPILIVLVCSAPSVEAVNMGQILSGETRTGSMASLSQADVFTFDGQAGRSVVVQAVRLAGDLNPKILLFAPDGTPATTATSAPNGSVAAIVGYQLSQTGPYTLVLQDWDWSPGFKPGVTDSTQNAVGESIAEYALSFLLIPGPTVSPQDSDGGDIISGETKVGKKIDPKADTDAYTFDGQAGHSVVIEMTALGGTLNPEILLFAPDGTTATSANGDSYAAIVAYQLGQSGTYTIVAKDRGGEGVGDYSIALTKIPPLPSSPAIRILLNQGVFHTGNTLIVSAHVLNGPNAAEVEVKLWIELPNGSEMSIFNSHFIFTVAPYADFTTEVFRYTFGGSEPTGAYKVGGRFSKPISGRELSVNVESFNFAP